MWRRAISDWEKVRKEFGTTPATFKELAEKYTVRRGLYGPGKSREGWEKKVQRHPRSLQRKALKQQKESFQRCQKKQKQTA